MSNHYHIVLHIDKARCDNWSFDEVIERWHELFSGCILSQRYVKKYKLGVAELKTLEDSVKIWRNRIMDISWFMRILNEGVARQANDENICTGRFWEGRFKSQGLLDEGALAACMAYVDLNPISAKIAETPERSDYTSIKARVTRAKKQTKPNAIKQQPKNLFPFVGNPRKNMPSDLHFRLSDYIELVDWSGRILRKEKRGFIDNSIPPVLQRLSIDEDSWKHLNQYFESSFKGFVGSAINVKEVCAKLNYQRSPGLGNCERYFS